MGIRHFFARLFSPIIRLLSQEFGFIEGNYRILIVSWVIMDLAMEMPHPNYQFYVEALGGKEFPMAFGIIGFASFLALALVAFPGGYLADKYGRRRLITTMTFGLALSYLFYALAPTWHFILIGAIIQGFCLIYQPALFAMVQDSLPPERRGVGSSLIQMIHGTFNTPGPVLGGILMLIFGLVTSMRIVYLIVMSLFIGAAIVRLWLKETVARPEPMRFRYVISSYPEAVRECCINVWKTVPKAVLWLLVVQIMFMFANAQIIVINALYAENQLGIPKETWWIAFVPLLLTMMIASIPIGKTIDRIGPRTPLMIAPIVLATSSLLFVNGNFLSIMVSMCLNGIVFLLLMSSAMTFTAYLVGPENRGKVRGFLNFAGNLSQGMGMLLGNYFYTLVPQLPFYLNIILSFPMIVVIFLRIHKPETY